MSQTTNYQAFETFVFRTPFFSFQEFQNNLKLLDENENLWQDFLQNKYFQEALFLASPILFDEIENFLKGYLTLPKDIEHLKMSVMRYYTRMSTRCTPFGLFAGFSLGTLDKETHIELCDLAQYKRYTRLDMNYLCSMAQKIGKEPAIRTSLKYYPNTSIYCIGNKLRYVEYFYENAKRVHFSAAVDNSEYLQIVLNKAQMGGLIEDLAVLLIDADINMEEAAAFIHELIDNQILVSEFDPEITGKDFLRQVEKTLKKVYGNESLKERIAELNQLLQKIDTEIIGETLPIYPSIERIIKKLEIAYEANFLFQTDLFKPSKQAILDKNIVQNILECLELLNKLSLPVSETLLARFAETFSSRYETREIPLLEVLDVETGIGYSPSSSGDISPLLNGYSLPDQQENVKLRWNSIQSFLHKKYLEASKNNAYSVNIEEKDVEDFKSNWEDLPITLSCMCEIFSIDDRPLIHLRSCGGSSAANLLGRFCHVTEHLESYVKEITTYEQLLNEDVIYAEIVHLPESRIGNILLRPILRSYEIPYLAKSAVDTDHQIPLSDLYVSVSGTRIFLRSKRLNKQVIPRMSTAHNFSFNAMPVYHFLCDMQTQGLRGGLGFTWGQLQNEYDFLPRVTYKNVIVSLAKWVVQTKDFEKIMEKKDKKDIHESLQLWRKDKKFLRYMVLADGDNTLFVDFENLLSVKTLYSTVKKRQSFLLEEFPFDQESGLVKNNKGEIFTNEFIIGLYKK